MYILGVSFCIGYYFYQFVYIFVDWDFNGIIGGICFGIVVCDYVFFKFVLFYSFMDLVIEFIKVNIDFVIVIIGDKYFINFFE